MKKWFKENIWWTSFAGIFAFGFFGVLLYCYLKNGTTLRTILLSDWLSYFAACGTIGGFLYLILDKVNSEKEMNHLKWQSQIPFVTLTSPCDPTSSYCEINILTYDTGFTERGSGYFSVCNLSKLNAYDIKILFCTKDDFSESNIFNRHYIPYLPPLETIISNGECYFANREYIYSNYNVNPDTKEISNAKFEICGCLDNCQISSTSTGEKFFFAKIEYYSSFSKKHRYKITSTLKVIVICSSDNVPEKVIRIKGINFLNYEYEDN